MLVVIYKAEIWLLIFSYKYFHFVQVVSNVLCIQLMYSIIINFS